jgi:hypothetical protein
MKRISIATLFIAALLATSLAVALPVLAAFSDPNPDDIKSTTYARDASGVSIGD